MKQYHEITKTLKEADAVLIGASNGFSISEGLHLFAENQAFIDLFSDFRYKYGIRNILQGCSFSYLAETEKRAFWSRLKKMVLSRTHLFRNVRNAAEICKSMFRLTATLFQTKRHRKHLRAKCRLHYNQ